jgi:tetratricopeptide (TPR) repeat protein
MLGGLHNIRDDLVAMELTPTIDEKWPALRDRWIALPRHGNLLHAIAPKGDRSVLLRFAALDRDREKCVLDDKTSSLAAAFGAQLANVFTHVLRTISVSDRGLFLHPFAFVDLDREVRVGFECGASRRPPDPKLDERAFVYVVGTLWSSLFHDVPNTGIGKIMRRCVEVDRRARFRSLAKLQSACLDWSHGRGLRSDRRLHEWYVFETAVGWQAIGDLDRARDWFRCAGAYESYRRPARDGLADVEEPHLIEIIEPPAAPPAPPLTPPIPIPMSPARVAYLEGRALFLQRKLHDARVCFASAILLDPMMLEAQLLRREVDRMLSRVRATTGTPTAMPIDTPASLREVRDIVVGGRIRDAIAVLSTDAYANNIDTPLFRARLLALDGQYARAASDFAAITDGPHLAEARLGLARVTIDRGNPAGALAILNEILAARPRDLGALEARARCLELLGRTSEAAEAMQAFVAAVELASDVRLARST